MSITDYNHIDEQIIPNEPYDPYWDIDDDYNDTIIDITSGDELQDEDDDIEF